MAASGSNKGLYVFAGVSCIALSISGYYLWTRRAALYAYIDKVRRIRLLHETSDGSAVGVPTSGSLTPKSSSHDFQDLVASSDNEQRIQVGKEYKVTGNMLFAKGLYDEAIDAYSKSIEAFPDDCSEKALSFSNRAACALTQKNFDAVIADCEDALRLQPLYHKAIERRGRAYEGKGMLRDALKDFTLSSILGGFKDEKLMKRTDDLLKALCQKSSIQLFEIREKRLASARYCRELFDSFSPLVPLDSLKDVDEHVRSAVKAMHAGDFAVAMNHFRNCPDNASVPRFLVGNYYGTLLFLSGKYEDALAQFDVALAHSQEAQKEEHAEVMMKKIFILFELESVEQAMALLIKATEQGAHNPYVAFHRAEINMLLGDFQAALDSFDQCVKIRGDFLPAYLHKAKLLMAMERVDESHTLMKRVATKLFSEDAEALNAYGETFLFLQDYETARSWFQKALNLDAKNVSALINMAAVSMATPTGTSQDSFTSEQVKHFLEMALAVEPQSDTVHLQMANYYLMSKPFGEQANYGEAIEMAKKHFDLALDYSRSFQEFNQILLTRESTLIQAELFLQYPQLESLIASHSPAK